MNKSFLVLFFKKEHTSFLLAALLLCLPVLALHALKYPDFSSFWAGADQHRYLVSTQAWAAGDLSPDRHHYLPDYPLLGAAFVWLTPWQPFLLPDLACLIASLYVFLRIGRRLAPGWPDGALSLCFALSVLGGRTLLAIWTVPWSTTGSAPFQFLALLCAIRFGEHPKPSRIAMLGGAIGIIAGFRPSDAAVLAPCCGLYVLVVLARGTSWRQTILSVAGGMVGTAAGLLPAVWAHVAINGWHAGPYVAESARIGFEWRLLPLRWVMLVVSPHPMFPEGTGMAARLPFIAPGLAGMLLAVFLSWRRITPVILVAGAVALHWAVYLCYRDLQPYGLWRYYNVHYFKWTFPFLVLWAVQLILALALPGKRRLAVAALCLCLPLFIWRPALVRRVAAPLVVSGRSITLPFVSQLNVAIELPLTGDFTSIYGGDFDLEAGGKHFVNKGDFKMFPLSSGALLMPLRVLPPGPATLSLPQGVGIIPGRSIQLGQEAIIFSF